MYKMQSIGAYILGLKSGRAAHITLEAHIYFPSGFANPEFVSLSIGPAKLPNSINQKGFPLNPKLS